MASDLGLMSGAGMSSGFGGWGEVISRGLDLFNRFTNGGIALPGGTDYDLPGADLGFGDPMSTALWRQTGTGYRQLATAVIPSPDGKLGFWKAAGRPVLFSGDLAACKRVQRVASRASRAVGRSRGYGRRRRGGR